MKNKILAELQQTTHGLLDMISKFTQEEFNRVPFEGSWAPGQVADHIAKAEAGIPAVWRGRTHPTERAVDANLPFLEKIFLDFSTKLKSPDFILPSNEALDKQTLYNSIKNTRASIEELAATIDLSLTYTDFLFPTIGELTGIEGAVFIISHSKRHIHQLQKML
ncbi:MAG: DinB family protein [Sediminibacterium sp.]|nr:DinB family protein [Sediminibacterium sp.]